MEKLEAYKYVPRGKSDSAKLAIKEAKQDNTITIWHWNVNGLKTIMKGNKLQEFLSLYKPKILCLNETKISEPETSLAEYFGSSNARLQFAFCSSRKNYSGVAILYDSSYIGNHLSMQVGLGDDELD
jgi:exonuclease III